MGSRRLVSVKAAMVAMAMMVSFVGCGVAGDKIDKDATVITIDEGKETISLGYANFVARMTQATYDQMYLGYFGEQMWSTDLQQSGSTFEADVKESVLIMLQEDYLCRLHAADYGVELSAEDVAEIDAAVKTFMESNSKSALEEIGATEEYVKTYLENQAYISKVSRAIMDSANVEVTKDEAWQRGISYVFLSTGYATDADGNEIEITDEYVAEKAALADEIAKASDFDAAVESAGLTANAVTYTKGSTENAYLDPTVIEAAESLLEGQVSAPIFVEGTGYYVVRIDKDYDEEATTSEIESLINEKETAFYQDVLTGWKEVLGWTVDEEQWAKVKFDVLFKAPETAEEAEASEE